MIEIDLKPKENDLKNKSSSKMKKYLITAVSLASLAYAVFFTSPISARSNNKLYDETGEEVGEVDENNYITYKNKNYVLKNKTKIRKMNKTIYIDSLVEDLCITDLVKYVSEFNKGYVGAKGMVGSEEDISNLLHMMYSKASENFGENNHINDVSYSANLLKFVYENRNKCKEDEIKTKFFEDLVFRACFTYGILLYEARVALQEKSGSFSPNFGEASKFFETAYKIKKRKDVKDLLINCYNKVGKDLLNGKAYMKAIAVYKKLAELDYKKDDAYYKIGHIYSLFGDYGNAAIYLKKALSINPKHESATELLKNLKK